jgi:hypothetical protein
VGVSLCAVFLVAALTYSCSEESTSRPGEAGTVDQGQAQLDGNVTGDGPKNPKILGEQHGGWRQAKCDDCHTLPEKGHTEGDPTKCAQCHGGNGACKPNGTSSKRQDHQQTDDCVSCHQQQHGFADSCTNCHFASAGTLDCPDVKNDAGIKYDGAPPILDGGGAAPTLSANLKHNCFNWPAQEFTPANHAGWVTSVKAGQLAIELDLKDTSGKAYTLSGLLASKPVWMQFGAYT